MVVTPAPTPADKPQLLPTPGIPAHFDFNQAIKHQLDAADITGTASKAVVITGAKVGDAPATARIALVLKNDLGQWDMTTKVYGEVTQGLKPTVGVQVVLMK